MDKRRDKKIRIAHVYKSFLPEHVGGCEIVIDSLVKATTLLNCHNKILTIGVGKKITQEERTDAVIKKYPATMNIASCPFSRSLLQNFKKELFNTDLIHYHFPWPTADFMHLVTKTKKPYIITYHSDIVRQKFLNLLYKPIMHAFFRKASQLIATSENLLKSSNVLQQYNNKTRSIPIGIDDQYYFPVNQTLLHHYRMRFGTDFMLFIGVLRYYKGLHILLDAIRGSDVKLVIAGYGPEERRLRQQARKYNLNNVYFVGRITDCQKSALLQLCRGVIVPSHLRAEAFSVSLLEGQIFSKPLICTEINTGTSYVNIDEVTGFTVPPNNVQALQRALIRIHHDVKLANTLGNASRMRYEHYFKSQIAAKKYVKIYWEVLNECTAKIGSHRQL